MLAGIDLMALIAIIASVSIGLNVLLSGLMKILEVFKDRTTTEVDNKFHAFLGKLSDVLKVVIQWSAANRQPSVTPAPTETPKA